MKRINLFCSAGMSTSMLASAMQTAADHHQLPIEIQAFPLHQIDDVIRFQQPDCILLGPQSRFMYADVVERYGVLQIPIAVIDAEAYGMMNGEKVLKSAIKMIKSNKMND